MKKMIEKAAFIAALGGSGAAFGHAGEHGNMGFLAALVHFLGQHGYLAIGLLLGAGVFYILRSRQS